MGGKRRNQQQQQLDFVPGHILIQLGHPAGNNILYPLVPVDPKEEISPFFSLLNNIF